MQHCILKSLVTDCITQIGQDAKSRTILFCLILLPDIFPAQLFGCYPMVLSVHQGNGLRARNILSDSCVR